MGDDIFEMVRKLMNKLSVKYEKDFEFYLAFLAKTKGEPYAESVKLHSFQTVVLDGHILKPNPVVSKVLSLVRMLALAEIITETEYDNLTRMLFSADDSDKYLALKLIELKHREYHKFIKTPEGEEKLYKILDNYYIDVVKFVNDKLLKR